MREHVCLTLFSLTNRLNLALCFINYPHSVIILPGMNIGGTLVSYWWVLGFQKAVLQTATTDWWVLGQ